MGCVPLLFEQRACQSTARTAPVGPVGCTAAKTVPSRLSLISLRFFGSDSGLSPLSWAAAADYVEILCSRIGCVACRSLRPQGNSQFLPPVMPERRASCAALAAGPPGDILGQGT